MKGVTIKPTSLRCEPTSQQVSCHELLPELCDLLTHPLGGLQFRSRPERSTNVAARSTPSILRMHCRSLNRSSPLAPTTSRTVVLLLELTDAKDKKHTFSLYPPGGSSVDKEPKFIPNLLLAPPTPRKSAKMVEFSVPKSPHFTASCCE